MSDVNPLNIQRKLYRLPWTSDDNVNGWIEPTYQCDLRCKGCYRDRWDEKFSLDEMKVFVDRTIEARNCDHITIAGGDPLLVNYLEELIKYIKGKGRRVSVLSNGTSLKPKRVESLKKSGLDRLTLHIDSGQDRPGWEDKTELELMELREHYASLVSDFGLTLGLIMVVYEDTFKYLPDIVRWCIQNSDRVSNITFDLFRCYPTREEIGHFFTSSGRRIETEEVLDSFHTSNERSLTIHDIYSCLKQTLGNFSPHSYLNGTEKYQELKWLISTAIVSETEVLGFVGPKSMEFVNSFYHFLKGRYPTFIGSEPSGKRIFLASLFDVEMRKAFKTFIKSCIRDPFRFLQKPNLLTIAIIQPCDLDIEGGQNMCDGCPDAILHDNKLVPSCRLDEYKRFGSPIRFAFKE